MASNVAIGQNQIGIIVRGKLNDKHSPGVMEQHADCILPGGEPVGFFGGEGDHSSGSSGSSSGSSSNSWANGPSLSWNSTGMNMKGMVAHYPELRRIRPWYVDIKQAQKYKVKSTVLVLDVTKAQADLFKQFWKNLKLNPGGFSLLGANCSTHASEAFIAANIVSKGIPGLDTPDNLYKQIKTSHSGSKKTYSGHIGAEKNGIHYDLIIG